MSKESLIPDQVNDDSIPKLKIDTHRINNLIEAEAKLKSYYNLFIKYLQTIDNEPSPTKKRYYGQHLEVLIAKIQKDKIDAENSKIKLIQKISSFIEILANPQNISVISDKAQKIIENAQISNFHISVTQEITQKISNYIKTDLIYWAENKQDAELVSQLKEQYTKLNASPPIKEIEENHSIKGQRFWESCLNLTEKFFPPKALEFNFNEEYKKHLDQFKKEKNPFITGILNSIKINLNNDIAGAIIGNQIQNSICSFDPNARIAQISQIIVKLVKKLFIYLQSKIHT